MKHSLASSFQSGYRDAGESFPLPDPSHAFICLPFDAHARRIDTERGRESRPYFVTMGREPRSLSDDADVHLIDAVSNSRDSSYRGLEHSDGIAVLIGWIGVWKHLADVTQTCRAEDRVGNRVANGISVRMTEQAEFRR